jgi:hypothetical protein
MSDSFGLDEKVTFVFLKDNGHYHTGPSQQGPFIPLLSAILKRILNSGESTWRVIGINYGGEP